MSVEHFVLDFSPPSPMILFEVDARGQVFNLIREFGMKGPVISANLADDEGLVYYVFTGKDDKIGSQLTLRSFPTGLIALDIMHLVKKDQDSSITMKEVEQLFNDLTNTLSCHKSKRGMFPFKRGANIHNYEYTSDNRLVEYDFDKTLFDAQSPWQHIKILHSEQFGNCLILDSMINIAESDLVYTETILGNGRHSFTDKSVLILGGGDGGLLHELLQENPRFITMVELDQEVIDCCKKYLRGVCGDSLDKLKGQNYEVLVTDCFPVLDQYIEEGKKFDFVISDLTDVPISEDKESGPQWELLIKAINKGLQVLEPRGRLLTHATGVLCKKAIAQFEDKIQNLPIAVEMKSDQAYIPSFQESILFLLNGTRAPRPSKGAGKN